MVTAETKTWDTINKISNQFSVIPPYSRSSALATAVIKVKGPKDSADTNFDFEHCIRMEMKVYGKDKPRLPGWFIYHGKLIANTEHAVDTALSCWGLTVRDIIQHYGKLDFGTNYEVKLLDILEVFERVHS